MKIYSWNVNGLRSVIRKGVLQSFLKKYRPDMLCMQETKISAEQVEEENIRGTFANYVQYYSFAEQRGYSGTAIWIRKALSEKVLPQESAADHLNEGRVTVVDTGDFFLVSAYVPNAKPDLSRLEVRQQWDKNFTKFLGGLTEIKPLIICGDMNVAHQPIDLARPRENEGKHGYTTEERAGFAALLAERDLLDSYRYLHPDTVAYSWWSHWGRARARNVGWRIDYFLISEQLKAGLKSAKIYPMIAGSDHCPISIEIAP